MRASPPGRAGQGGQRQKTFTAGLQQAHELATAAEHAGYPTRPILLFYALSQAFRAVCAAHLPAHDLTIADMHPAVDNPDTLLVCCPDLPAAPDELLRNIADLLSRLLSLPSADAVRIAAYPDRAAAHAASGDSAA